MPAAIAYPQLRSICLAFPNAAEEIVGASGEHAKFTVSGNAFARFHDNHHGDGVVAVVCRAAAGMQAVLTTSDPARFFVPAYSGHRGDVGLRLDVVDMDWDQVRDVVLESYLLAATKRRRVKG